MIKKLISFYNNVILDKKSFFKLQILVFTSSVSEIISLSLILPYFDFIQNGNENITFFIDYYTPLFSNYPKLFFGIILILIYLSSSALSTFCLFKISKYSASEGYLINQRLFKNYLFNNYLFHSKNNSAELIKKLTIDSQKCINNILYHSLILLSKLLLIFGIYIMLFIFNPKIAIVISILFLIFYFSFFNFVKTKLNYLGKIITTFNFHKIKIINEALSSIKEMIILNKRGFIFEEFSKYDKNILNSNAKIIVIAQLPKYIIEGALYSALIILTLFLFVYSEENISIYLPSLMIFAVAALKIIPGSQNIYHSFSLIKSNLPSFKSIEQDIKSGEKIYRKSLVHEKSNLNFKDSITLKNVGFAYGNKTVLRKVNIKIKKNTTNLFLGESGSGKSTLINLITGLLECNIGSINIDHKKLNNKNLRSWQKLLSYSDQNIFLFDASIKDNICFGIESNSIDQKKLNNVIKILNLEEFNKKNSIGVNFNVGDKGLKLSGGQRQRIGLARTFYSLKDIVILDEPTNFLDEENEKRVLDYIKKINKYRTIIIVSHKKEFKKIADNVFLVKNQTVKKI